MSAIQDRIAAKKKRIEELRRARENFTLTKVAEEDGGGGDKDDGGATPEPSSPQIGSRGPSSPFSTVPPEDIVPPAESPIGEGFTRARTSTLSRMASMSERGPISRTRSSSVLSTQSGGENGGSTDGASVRQSTARVIALSAEVDNLKRDVQTRQAALEAAQRETESLKDQNAMLQSVIIDKDRQLEKLTEKNEASSSALAKLQERLQALQASLSVSSPSSSRDRSAAEKLAKLEAEFAMEKLNWQERYEALERSYTEAQENNNLFTQQFEALAELFYSTFGEEGAAGNHLDLFKNLRDERAVIEEELKELQAMNELQLAEIGELRSAVQRLTSSQAYLEDALAEYEEENKMLADQLAMFQEQKKKDSGHLSEEIKTLQGRLHETESQLQSFTSTDKHTQKEVETLRSQLQAANATVETLRNTKETLLTQIEELQQQIETKEKESAKAKVELERVCFTAEEREKSMQKDVEESRQQAETVKRELVAIKQVMDTQIESVRAEWREQSQDLMEAKVEAEAARKEYLTMQASIEEAMSCLKTELSSSKNDMEMAAIAGLNLTELVSTLREDKATTEQKVVELSAALKTSEERIQEIQAQLDARNELLTQVMNHLQAQARAGDEEEPEDDTHKPAKPFDPAAGLEHLQELKHRLEKAGRDYQSLQEALSDYEIETKALNEKLKELTKEHDDVVADRNRLEGQLKIQTEQLEETQSKLEEREGMLTEVMTFLKTKGGALGNEGAGADGEEGEDLGDADRALANRAGMDLRAALNAQMAEAAAERAQLVAKIGEKEEEIKQLHAAHADTAKRMTDQIDNLESQVSRLRNAEERAARFESALDDANTDRKGLNAFLETSREKILSLESELNTVAAKLAKSEERVGSLETELATANNNCKALGADLASTRSRVAELEVELTSTKNTLSTAQERVVVLETDLETANNDKRALREDLDAARGRVSELEGALLETKSRLDEALSELAEVKEALAATSENMEAAAMAGLTLTEMINKMKADHAAAVAKLEAENAKLRKEFEDYRERIAEMLRMMAPAGGDEGDILNQLKLRLQRALDDRQHLEGLLTASDDENQKLSRTVDGLKEQREKLLTEISELKAKIDALETDLRTTKDELEHFKALCERAASIVKVPRDSDSGEKEIDASLLNGLTRQGMDALLASLEAQMARLRELEAALSSARADLQALRLERAGLETRIGDLEGENSHLRQIKESLDKQIVGLLERINFLEHALSEARKTIEEQLETIRKLTAAMNNLMSLQKNPDTSALDKIRHLEDELAKVRDEYLKLKQQLLTERETARNRFLRKWEQNTRNCMECNLEFSVLRRPHHCRLCGKVLCRYCCSDRVHTSASRRAVRVCKGCYDFMNVIAHEKAVSDIVKKRTKEVKLMKNEGETSFGVDLTFKPLGDKASDGISAFVRSVKPDLAAFRAGLQEGDIIVCVNNIDLDVATQEDIVSQFKSTSVNLVVQLNGPDEFEVNTTTYLNTSTEVDELSDSSGASTPTRSSPLMIVTAVTSKDHSLKSPSGIPPSILSSQIRSTSASESPVSVRPRASSGSSTAPSQAAGAAASAKDHSSSQPFAPIESAPTSGGDGSNSRLSIPKPSSPTPSVASRQSKSSESVRLPASNPFSSDTSASSTAKSKSPVEGLSSSMRNNPFADPVAQPAPASKEIPADAASEAAAMTASESASTPVKRTKAPPKRSVSASRPAELLE